MVLLTDFGSAVQGAAVTVAKKRMRLRVALTAGLALGLILSGAGVVPVLPESASAAAASDNYSLLRDRWLRYLIGDTPDTSDPDIQVAVTTRDTLANDYWTSLDTGASRTTLWADAADWSTPETLISTIATSYSRLKAMAIAYRSTGSPLANNTTLRNDIVAAMEWLNVNHYNASKTETGNWYTWEIAIPRTLGELMVLMYSDMSPAQRQASIAAIDHWCGDPTRRTQYAATVETGANRADKALNVILRGAVGDSSSKIVQGRDALNQIYPYVTKGDGFYADGSFVFHGANSYTGGYGTPLLQSMGGAFYLLQGSAWPITHPEASNVYAWVDEAFIPVVYKGALMDMTRGRKIGREDESDHAAARFLAGYIAVVAEFAPSAKALSYKKQLKAWMTADPETNYYEKQNLHVVQLLKAILTDSAITATPGQQFSTVMSGMGRAVQQSPNSAFGISLFSDRLSAFTSGNGENLRGWWTGAGQTAIYTADPYQFDEHYWATVDMTRLPGTTTDRSTGGTPGNFVNYFNTSSWAGGSTVDRSYSSVGMQYSMTNVTGSNLTGKKSWFLLGDKMVALGAGISGSGDVETIVDNRRFNGTPTNVTLNGVDTPVSMTGGRTTANSTWAYVTGANTASSVGYLFLNNPTVTALNEVRTGAWNAQSTSGTSTTRSNQFGSVAIEHGQSPTNGSYAYAVLPGRSSAQTQTASTTPGFTVVRNDATVQAVNESATGVTGANFWNDGSTTLNVGGSPFITVDKKASVTTREANNEIVVAVSDPTQKNTGKINVEINRASAGVIAADPRVTITQFSPTIKLTVDVKGEPGTNFQVRLRASGSSATPAQPSTPVATVHGGRISLDWNLVGGETGYVVKYGTSAGQLTQTLAVNTVSAKNHVDVTGLTNGTPYFFSVTAVSGSGSSTPSATVSATPNEVANPTVTMTTSADAFVRDGSYGTTNYGTLDRLEVKNDGPVNGGFNRFGYLKFDISNVQDRVDAATLRLTVLSRGQANVTNQILAVNLDAAWTETGLTYSNRPADATAATSFQAPAAGESIDVDVTAAVQAARAAGKTELTLRVLSPVAQGSAAQVNYASLQNTNTAARASLTINAPNPTVNLQATGDAFVRDGAANADVNAGTSTGLTVKNDAVGYARQSYLSYDLTSITGAVDVAKLRLVTTSVGMSGIVHAVYVANSATWNETTLTWNNKPALGTLATTWTVPATTATAVEIDLTSQVQAARAAGATKLTLVIVQSTHQGSSSSVTYASKETGTTANRPVLTIN